MSELSIKVTIAGRIYPITVEADEEDNVREAAKNVDINLKHLQENFAVKDKQDLLAMTALQMAIKVKDSEHSVKAEAQSGDLEAIESLIDQML